MLKARILLGLLFGLLICAAISRAVNPWSPRPNWVSTDNEFTMSVAFADIDNEDSYLELLAGNYNYPYSSFGSNPEELGLDEIGAQLVVYYDWDQENQCYNSSTDLTETPRCIDCIAVADYNNDSHMDIAMGLVVGKGKDGGVIVLENQADTSPASMEDYFRDDVSGCYWKSDESYDCHVVRWVDFDCDGDLDLAALEVPSILHIYENVEPIAGENMISNDCAWVYYLGTDDSGTDDLEHSTTSPIEGTTMEFGDIDNDGDLDVFINAANQARVFENIDGDYPGDYYSLNPAVQNYREDAFCGSFAPDGDQLVLAVGSFQFVDNPNDPMEEQRWGNDIYSFEDPYLVHQGRSTVSGSFPAQSVTDIQWAYLDEYDDRDLVAVSYPIYKENGPDDYIWDRGYEQIHLDPLTYTGDEFLTDIWTSSSGYSDLSTSLALGDIDGESAYIEEVIIDEATVSGNFPYLFHLDKFPFISLEEVIVIDENQNWLCWGNDDFDVAYDPLNGWISIDNRFIPPINWAEVRYIYNYSSEFDLAVGNNGNNVIYLYDETGSMGEESTTVMPALPPYGSSPYTYSEPLELNNDDANLMGENCVGSTWEYGISQGVEDYMNKHESIKRVGVLHSWDFIEMFQGHYFWNQLDTKLDTVQSKSGVSHLCIWWSPCWTHGNATYGVVDTRYRPSDERLHSLFIRNLVNRYRPNGAIATASYDWDDWGVEIYQSTQEPNITSEGYGFFPGVDDAPVESIAEKLYYQYQIVKSISEAAYPSPDDPDKLKVVSPNVCPELFSNESEEIYVCPSMPYFNAVNDIDLTHLHSNAEKALWNYCDFLCTQIYPGKNPRNEEEFCFPKDPFNRVNVPDHPDLRIGFEHFLWGFYTYGLDIYIEDCLGTAPEGDWKPVMYDLGTGESSEHPFFIFDLWYGNDWWGDPQVAPPIPDADLPLDDWYSGCIAEMFSIDVFPEDPDINHRLVKYHPNRFFQYHDPYETCGKLLNAPGVTFESYQEISTYSYGAPGPPLHCYTFREPNGAATGDQDAFVHFLRTDQGETYEFLPEQFVSPYFPLTGVLLMNYQGPATPAGVVGKLDCYTPSGQYYQKEVKANPFCWVDFCNTEAGPGMLIMHEYDPEWQDDYNQSIQLHKGHNMVSWQIVVPDPTPEDYLKMMDILPDEIGGEDTWFNLLNGQVRTHSQSPEDYYPVTNQSELWEWNVNFAYQVSLPEPHCWNDFSYRPRIVDESGYEGFTIEPTDDWDPGPLATKWHFIGFSGAGYCKLASVPNGTTLPLTGDPSLYDYEGPFHWLIWEDSPGYPTYDLKIVKADDGRFYIPLTPNDPPRMIDEIGYLEPGKGYQLGFDTEESNPSYDFDGWGYYPGTANSIISDPKFSGNDQTASVGHFQFNEYTHWFYPVIIDTVDLEQCPLEPGDGIGVFDGALCVGASSYNGEFPITIACWKDDIVTPDEIDGYCDDNPMTFIWYDASQNAEIEFEPPQMISAAQDDPVAPTHSGFGRGFYALRSFTNGVKAVVQLPTEFSLGQNFPNPFNAETVIPLTLPERSNVKIDLFNIRGQHIITVHEGIENAGYRKVNFNAAPLSSGVYFYRINAEGLEKGGNFMDVGKMLLVK